MMTEQEAWMELAIKWSNARPNRLGNYATIDNYGKLDDDGLCCSIDSLWYLCKIDVDTRRNMLDKISKQEREEDNNRSYCAYKWPLTKEGSEKRVLFCLKQYNALK